MQLISRSILKLIYPQFCSLFLPVNVEPATLYRCDSLAAGFTDIRADRDIRITFGIYAARVSVRESGGRGA